MGRLRSPPREGCLPPQRVPSPEQRRGDPGATPAALPAPGLRHGPPRSIPAPHLGLQRGARRSGQAQAR